MKEIIGKELDLAMVVLDIDAEKTYQSKEKGFQVWKLDERNFKKLESVEESDWKDDFGWWRTGGCVYEGTADFEYVVNQQPMDGYKSQEIFEEDGDVWFEEIFADFESFMHGAMNLTTIKNFSIFAMSLAKDNNLSVTDFMKKYQP